MIRRPRSSTLSPYTPLSGSRWARGARARWYSAARPARTPPPLALYVHFPWCVRKCPYCDFNSYALTGNLPEEAYVTALAREIEVQCAAVADQTVISVFMGGGTPSLFPPEALGRVLESARRHLRISPAAEI